LPVGKKALAISKNSLITTLGGVSNRNSPEAALNIDLKMGSIRSIAQPDLSNIPIDWSINI